MPAFIIQPLKAEHAAAAAAIHAEGQPGTFLTSLGASFLRALYTELARSPQALGLVALEDGQVAGVVTVTSDAGAVFKDLILRRGPRLALPVAGAVLRRPGLVPKVLQTFLYPARAGSEPGEAELLFIGTRAERRGQGIGQALFQQAAAALRERGMRTMGLTVDDANEVAKRFYEHQGMHCSHALKLYGRPMQWYVLPLVCEDDHGCSNQV